MLKRYALMVGLILLVLLEANASPRIEVYYFPGWKKGASTARLLPWEPIQRNQGMQPLLGWYEEGDESVLATQLNQMKNGGVDALVFDWYWDGRKPRLNHVIETYLGRRRDFKFSILWANHSDDPISKDSFREIVKYWVDVLFASPDYQRVDGYPIIRIFDPVRFEKNVRRFGASAKEMLDLARAEARAKGFAGIYIVGLTDASEDVIKNIIEPAGYDAVSGYNYHQGVGTPGRRPRFSHSYSELSAGYVEQWKKITGLTSLPYILPVTSGWNRRAWGGSVDPLHDQSSGTPGEFYYHLLEAKNFIEKVGSKKTSAIVVCCWNEYGEGSVIEPTREFGDGFVRQINRVFRR